MRSLPSSLAWPSSSLVLPSLFCYIGRRISSSNRRPLLLVERTNRNDLSPSRSPITMMISRFWWRDWPGIILCSTAGELQEWPGLVVLSPYQRPLGSRKSVNIISVYTSICGSLIIGHGIRKSVLRVEDFAWGGGRGWLHSDPLGLHVWSLLRETRRSFMSRLILIFRFYQRRRNMSTEENKFVLWLAMTMPRIRRPSSLLYTDAFSRNPTSPSTNSNNDSELRTWTASTTLVTSCSIYSDFSQTQPHSVPASLPVSV